MMKKQFNSVAEMSDNKEMVVDFEKTIAAKALVKKLFTLRQVKGLSQQELAAQLGWSQSRVSKLESSDDCDLRFGDVIAYISALGLELGVVLAPREASAVARVKHHAFAIKRITDQLADMAVGDEAIAKRVAGFFGEAAFNLIGILQESSKKVPLSPAESPFRITIEVVGEDSNVSPQHERPIKKSRKKTLV